MSSLEVTNIHAERSEIAISYVLRIGVICSLLLIAVGLAMSFAQHHGWMNAPSELPALVKAGRADVPSHWSDVTRGISHGDGQSVVMLGLLVLISTPVFRVAISIAVFAFQRDNIFVAITVLVLALLSLSFFLGKAEG